MSASRFIYYMLLYLMYSSIVDKLLFVLLDEYVQRATQRAWGFILNEYIRERYENMG